MRQAGLPANLQERIVRLRDLYHFWLEHPTLQDKAIVEENIRRYGVKKTQAYDDVSIVKVCIGAISRSSTDWYRYIFLQRAEEGFKMAREKESPVAFAKVLTALGKFTRLDKDETIRPDYSVIKPVEFTFTADPTVAGVKPIPDLDKKVREYLKKYTIEAEEV